MTPVIRIVAIKVPAKVCILPRKRRNHLDFVGLKPETKDFKVNSHMVSVGCAG